MQRAMPRSLHLHKSAAQGRKFTSYSVPERLARGAQEIGTIDAGFRGQREGGNPRGGAGAFACACCRAGPIGPGFPDSRQPPHQRSSRTRPGQQRRPDHPRFAASHAWSDPGTGPGRGRHSNAQRASYHRAVTAQHRPGPRTCAAPAHYGRTATGGQHMTRHLETCPHCRKPR